MTDQDTLTAHLAALTHLLDTLADVPLAELAARLAARGYPTDVRNEPGRVTSTDTSTERAALNRDRWADIDQLLNRWTQTMLPLVIGGHRLITDLVAHAAPDTLATRHRSAGSGWCLLCDRYCAGGEDDRLRAGWCHPCAESYRRWRQTHPHGDRATFALWRRNRTA